MLEKASNYKYQKPSQVIDVGNWSMDDIYDGIFPKGTRDKKALFSPDKTEYEFIVPKFRYLFKESMHQHQDAHKEQFWIEIIAYRLGCIMDVNVPPAFVSYIKEGNDVKYGALIEWFYKNYELYIDGGNILTKLIKNYDRKKGTQHNFDSITQIIPIIDEKVFVEHWAKVLVFDAIIGNTDRHQDNWGIIVGEKKNKPMPWFKLGPAFDNGTSMGYEVLEQNLAKYKDNNKMNMYISNPNKAKHHMKWNLSDKKNYNHFQFIKKYINKYPETENIITNILNFKISNIEYLFKELTKFDIEIPITKSRADFMLNLIHNRQKSLQKELGILK